MDLMFRPDTKKVRALMGGLATKGFSDYKFRGILKKYLQDRYNYTRISVSMDGDWGAKYYITVNSDDAEAKTCFRILEEIKQDFTDMPLNPVWKRYKAFRKTQIQLGHQKFIVNDVPFNELFLWLRDNAAPEDYQLTSLYGDDVTLILSDRIKSSLIDFKFRFDR